MEIDVHLTAEEKDKILNYFEFYNDDFLDFLRSAYTKSYEESVNQDYFISYENIIKRTAELMDKLHVKDYTLLVNLVFEYLLWGGYLSKDHKLVYRIKKRVNNFSCIGADIMKGYSVCLNNAEMLAKVYRELGYDAHTMGISAKRSCAKDISYKPDIKRDKTKGFMLLSTLVGPILGNHAITLVNENGVYYLYDPTNLTQLYIKDLMKGHFIGSDKLMNLKAWIMLMFENLSNDDFKKIILEIMLQGKVNLTMMSMDKYKDIVERYMVILKSNSDYLEQFYEKNRKDIDIVSKHLVK